MNVREWIDDVRSSRNLCHAYSLKVDEALNKVQLMDIVLDSNGISYLPQMRAKGHPLPYDVICNEYRGFINGRYVRDKDGYTSKMYCLYRDPITVDTTLTCLLGCTSTVIIGEYDFKALYMDSNCNVKVKCPESSRVEINIWEGARVDLSECKGKIDYKRH